MNTVNGSWKVSEDTVVCERHWPEGYSVCRRKGHERPSEPPSVFASGIFIHSPSQPLKEKEAKVVTKSMPDHSYALKDEIEKPVNFHELKEGLLSNDHNLIMKLLALYMKNVSIAYPKTFIHSERKH